MADGPVHFGVKVGVDSVAEFTERARLAERLGFDSFWVGANGRGHDPFALLAHVASVTSLRVGTAVALLPLHDPAEIARQVATLDQVSGGRVVFGVGAGGERPADFTVHNVDRSTRGRRMDEALPLIRRLWSGEEVRHEGRFFHVEGQLQVLPVQDHLPVWIGGRGGVSPVQRRVYERVVNAADGWMPYIMPADTYAKGQASIRELGGDDRTWAFVAHANVGDGDGVEALEFAAGRMAGNYARGGAASPEALARARAYVIAGNPDDCVERLNRYVDLGVTEVVFNWACPPGAEGEQMQRLAEDVLPRVQEHAQAGAAA
ncbi:MAG: LLM class flavin-dependent oxidoreductase [Dehalococcoidia bacterium]